MSKQHGAREQKRLAKAKAKREASRRQLGQSEFRALCKKLEDEERLAQVTPERFAKLVYCAADYGQSLGFPPHRDFRHAQRLLAGIAPSQCPDEFEFGQDGRPQYIRGPRETLDEARLIAARLQAQGADYVLPLRASEAPPELVHRARVADIEADDECAGDD